MNDNNLVARLTVKANKKYIPNIVQFVRDMVLQEGMKVEDARRLELITDEACLIVIQHAFDTVEKDYFDIIIEKKPGQIIVAIEDRGLPFDWQKVDRGEGQGLGIIIMKAFSDEIKFINLGRKGKRLELIKNISYDIISFPEEINITDEKPLTEEKDISIRFMSPDEGMALARCFYSSYGYTYNDYIYYPEQIKSLIKDGSLTSIVAVTKDEEIIGHIGMRKTSNDATVGEVVQAVVEPMYRGKKLFTKMQEKCIDYAREKDMYGLYGEVVTNHPYIQMANHRFGATETGILLGNIVERSNDKKEKDDKRETALLFYMKINEEPERTVYPPLQHTSMIKKIYEYGKFNRKFQKAMKKDLFNLPDVATVDVKVVPDYSLAFIRISQYGLDLKDLIRVHLKELCLNKIECIYVDLPMSEPGTFNFCSALEYLGFFFAGIIPELHNGDVLRLQYLNNVPIDKNSISLVSEFSKELFNYTIKCQGQVGIINLI